MNKIEKILDYLKQRNSGIFDFKKNVSNTIDELKDKHNKRHKDASHCKYFIKRRCS